MKVPRSMWIRGRLGAHLGYATFGFVLAALVLTCVFHLTIVEHFIVPGERVIENYQSGKGVLYREQSFIRSNDWERWGRNSDHPSYGVWTGFMEPLSYEGRSYQASTWEGLPAEDRGYFHDKAHEWGAVPVYGLGEGMLFKYELTLVAGMLTLFGFGPVWYPRTRRRLLHENRQDFERAQVLRLELEVQADPFAVPGAAGGKDLGMWRPTEVQPLPSFDIRGHRMVTDPFHGGFVVWLTNDEDKVLRLVCPGREALNTLFVKTVEGWFRANSETLPRYSHVGKVLAAYEFGAAGLDSNQVHTRLMRDMQLPLNERPALRVSGQVIALDTAIATELVHTDGAHQVVAPAGFFEGLQRTLRELSGVSLAPLPLQALVERPMLRIREEF